MSEIAALLRAGKQALKAGQKDKARQILTKVIKLDEQNEEGWLWLSGAVKTKSDRRLCLENVLTINPDNITAKKGLTQMGFPIPAQTPPPQPEPEPEVAEDWSTPLFEDEAIPPAEPDPHERKFDDVWDSQAHLCAYCAYPIKKSDKRCGQCKRPLIGKELASPHRSRYLIIWVILRSVGHFLSILGLLLAGAVINELASGLPINGNIFWLIAGGIMLISIGITAALYFRQAWAYWLSVVGVILSVISSVSTSISQSASVPVQNSPIPLWLAFVCALPFILIQVLYIYMIFMAYGDFKKEKAWRVAAASDRIKDPLTLDRVAQLLAKRQMWASAVLYWQRGAGRSPGNTAILRRLADGYAHLGFYERSMDTLQQALDKAKEPKVTAQINKRIAEIEGKIKKSK